MMCNRKWFKTAVSSFFAVLLIAGSANALAAQDKEKDNSKAAPEMASSAKSNQKANDDAYVIGPDDVLSIVVWKEPDFTKVVPVRPDGMISVALAGDVKAAGLTVKELQASLSAKLKAYVDNPEVSVSVQEFHSQKFNILGEVNKPGAYSLTGPTTILDAIAQAGGFKDFAKTKKIYILRTAADGKQLKLPFNYNEVIKGKQMDTNVELAPRDTIVVP
ncbi:MAG: polysaccharide biosynthesis/export family protein [Terriglobales bacterium]